HHQRPHHRRRPGARRPVHRRHRLAARRCGAADPWQGGHHGAAAGAARGRGSRRRREDHGVRAQQGDARGAGRAQGCEIRGAQRPEATALTGLFINHGPVVQLRDTAGRLEVLDDPEPAPAYDGPLAVLVDRLSASASEIFAGAIQDYHRGIILGQTTFGKGTVQNLVPLDRWSQKPVNGQLTVTIGKFYRVTGESTQHRGVEPDVPLASPLDTKEVGESALESALPWDRIAGVPFRVSTASAAAPPVAALATEEDARAQRDPAHRWLLSA